MLVYTYFFKAGLGFASACALVVLVTVVILKKFNSNFRINSNDI